MKSFIAFVLTLCLSFPVFANLKQQDLYGIKWGLDRDAIISVFKLKVTEEGLVWFNHIEEGQTGRVLLRFQDRKLIGGTFISDVNLKTGREVAMLCDGFAEKLQSKHGPAVAKIDPDLGPMLIWQNDTTELYQFCDFSHGGALILVSKMRYIPAKLGITL